MLLFLSKEPLSNLSPSLSRIREEGALSLLSPINLLAFIHFIVANVLSLSNFRLLHFFGVSVLLCSLSSQALLQALRPRLHLRPIILDGLLDLLPRALVFNFRLLRWFGVFELLRWGAAGRDFFVAADTFFRLGLLGGDSDFFAGFVLVAALVLEEIDGADGLC